ncbi:MAG: hypothetical protein DME24_13145 [Verrucomicrobia bacterium]|nr:MAG: hypothetical protein DME24_13145 [Verrucomicrobiota bacterium]
MKSRHYHREGNVSICCGVEPAARNRHAAPAPPRLNQDTANGNPPVPANVVTQSRFAKKILRSKLVRDYSLE